MPEIETFKTIYVNLDLSTDGKSYHDINVPFDVDEIVLKYFSLYNRDSDGPDMTALYTTLLGSECIVSFPKVNVMFETLKTSFKPTNNRIQGQYEFQALDPLSANQVFCAKLVVSFGLMFIKYKK